MLDDSPIRARAAWRDGVVVVLVQFDGSASLQRVLRAGNVPVRVLTSLSAAVEVLTVLPAAVLVVRLGSISPDDEDTITLVIRNFRTPGVLRDPRAAESFLDRFAEFFRGVVDTQTLGAAIMRHARPSMHGDRLVRRSVA